MKWCILPAGSGVVIEERSKMTFLLAALAVSVTIPLTDGGPCSSSSVVINEFMPCPLASTTETNGEWIELYNRSGNWVNLAGWTMENEFGQRVTLTTYLLPPEGYFVMAPCGDMELNGGYSPDFIYSGFTVQNTGRLTLSHDSRQVSDEVEYDSTWPIQSGCSCERINPGWISGMCSSWASATQTYGDGDFGTPGQQNSVYENSFAQNSWAFIKAFVQ
jgi:uncharacterized protein